MSTVPNDQTPAIDILRILQEKCASLKQDIVQKTSQLLNLLHPYLSRPPNEVLLTPTLRGRLVAMIKHLLGRHQVLYNALMELADHMSHVQNRSHQLRRTEAQEDWKRVGKKLGQEFYRVAGFLNEKDKRELREESSFEWKA